MRIFLIRHGETDWNVLKKIQGSTDRALNQQGVLQAKTLARRLVSQQYQIDKVYTSRLKRAKATAEIVSDELQVSCEVKSGLEEMNLGSWEGKTWKEVITCNQEDYQVWRDDVRYSRPPMGESYQEVLDRFIPALQEIASSHDGDVLVVTHSANIMTLLSYMNQTKFEDMNRNFPIRNAETVEIEGDEILELCCGYSSLV